MEFDVTGQQGMDFFTVNWWTEVAWITCGILCFYQLFGLSF